MRERTDSLDQWWKRHDEQLKNATEHHIRVFVRSRVPAHGTHNLREELIEKLERAEADNHIGTYDVTALGPDICLCEKCRSLRSGTDLRERVMELVNWREGLVQSSGFTHREVESSITNEQYQTISPPETTLGIYIDGSLTGVFPCIADGVTYGPETYLDGILTANHERMVEQLANMG
jgi:hypothetical protein